MLVLDSDHLRVLQEPGPHTARLLSRLKQSNQEVTTTIINVEENVRGWMAEINRAPSASSQVLYYERLQKLVAFYQRWHVLAFDTLAATRFEELRRLRLRSVGPMDLKIAAIVLGNDATLLSANLRHFRLVPDLKVDDWLEGSPGSYDPGLHS